MLAIRCCDQRAWSGLSGRPTYTPGSTEEAESWFVEGLETWRQKQGLGRFTLLGHSMGGMIAAHYAAAHPERVEHLVLCGPAGMASRAAPMPKDPPPLLRLMLALWERGGTPGMVVRGMGPRDRGWWAPTWAGASSKGRPCQRRRCGRTQTTSTRSWGSPAAASTAST